MKYFITKRMYKILLFLFLSLNLAAQIIPPAEPIEEEEPKEEQEEKPVLFEEPKPAWKQRMHYGGTFGCSFGVHCTPMFHRWLVMMLLTKEQ